MPLEEKRGMEQKMRNEEGEEKFSGSEEEKTQSKTRKGKMKIMVRKL